MTSSWCFNLLDYQATWIWVADHELDGDGSSNLGLFAGRGVLSESQGPVWLIGTGKLSLPVSLQHRLKIQQLVSA